MKHSNDKHTKVKQQLKKKTAAYTANIGERINQVCAQIGGKRRLAHIAEISESQLHRIIAGESQAKAETIAAIAMAAGVSLEWLMTGHSVPSIHGQASGIVDEDSFFIVPAFSESYGSTDIALRQSCIRDYIGADEKNIVMAQNDTDAMEPTISDNGKLVLDLSRGNERQGGIYALIINGEFLIRRLQYNFDKSVSILCDNPAYRAQTIPWEQLKEIEILGKVIWAGGKI